MSNRQLIRPKLGDIRQEPAATTRRKAPPPDSTSAEAFYYVKQMGAATPIVVVLNDGERLDGVMEWYDRMCIKLKRDGAPDLVIMKHAVRYIHKHEDFEEKDPLPEGDAPAVAPPTKRTRKS
jgi:host factor-I protein